MYLGQQLELNLRAILYAADYHGWGADIPMSEEESRRYRDTEGLIDQATCGLIIRKLSDTGIIPDARASKAFGQACEHRNKLAHTFLIEHNFDTITEQQEAAVVRRLHEMSIDLYQAVLISRSVRRRAETHSDEQHKRLRDLMRETGIENYEDPNRHYATRKRKKKGGRPAA